MHAILAPLFAVLAADVADPSFTQTTYTMDGLAFATGFVRPLDGTNRFFVAEKNGTVRVVENGVVLPDAMVTISPLYVVSECGLVGIALDPDFATNHYVYIFVTISNSEQQILRLTEDHGIGRDITPIITGLPTRGANHDGGAIGFGPDGNLYWAIGDNGNGTGVDADLASFCAKISRARPDGTALESNPFYDGTGPNNDYVWARGFRNPFTLTFEPARGRLWVNVVGTRYEQVFVVGQGDHAGWNNYENTQPAGFITPAIVYKTHGSDIRTVLAAARAGGAITVHTMEAHGFRKGEKITLAAVGDASFDGEVFVTAATSTGTFTALQAGPDATSGGGTATTLDTGGCITGGIFYDGTDFSPEYSGQYFFGDFSSDRILLANLDANGDVDKVDYFGSLFNAAVDMEVGLDGALYVLTHSAARIYRISTVHDAQKLIVSNTHLRLAEGGRAAIGVRLAIAPANDVTVAIAETSGDPDVAVESGATLTFTPENFDVPQAVMFGAALDLDTDEDIATFEVSATGLEAQTVHIAVTDHNAQTLVLSETALELAEGATGTFTVALAEMPLQDLTVTIVSPLPDLQITQASTLTFTPVNYDLPQPVMLAALEDDDTANESVNVMISADRTAARMLAVTIRDNDTRAPAFTSTPKTTAIAGATYEYAVAANGVPDPAISVDHGPAGTALDPATHVLSWLPLEVGAFELALVAANGVDPNAVQTFTVNVAADAPPTITIGKPTAGEALSGVSEWSANTTDDLGTVRAEFFVDGTLVETQMLAVDRYTRSLDTTALADGAHVLKVTAYDAKNQTGSSEITVTTLNAPQSTQPGESCGCRDTRRSDNRAAALLILGMLILRGRAPRVRRSSRDRR